VTATVLHPGVVRTAFGREDAGRSMRLMFPVVTPFMKSPEQGAATSIYLASSPEVAGVTGTYFADRRPKQSSRSGYDLDLARRLWEVSAALVGLGAQSRPENAKEQA
jgi:retinol dehydrogenase-14